MRMPVTIGQKVDQSARRIERPTANTGRHMERQTVASTRRSYSGRQRHVKRPASSSTGRASSPAATCSRSTPAGAPTRRAAAATIAQTGKERVRGIIGSVMPPSTWPWQTWLLSIAGAVVAGLLVVALKKVIVWGWRATLHRPFWLLKSALQAGRHHCGHWSGSYAADPKTGRRVCWQCHQVEMGAADARSRRGYRLPPA